MTFGWLDLSLVALGGAVGGLARVTVAGATARIFGERFPWGTLLVNVTGAGLIGILAGLALSADDGLAPGNAPQWALLATGVLGSYTTVSAFSLQTLTLIEDGAHRRAAANIAASLGLCLAAAAIGSAIVGGI